LKAKRTAAGAGPGFSLRYWFRGGYYAVPRSFIEFLLQYCLKIKGGERARGIFTMVAQLY